MTRINGRFGWPVALATAVLMTAGVSNAGVFQLADPIAVSTQAIAVTSDRCIQLEEQFDAAAGEQASNPHLPLAQSYREKGSYLCNNDVDDVGAQQLEQALRLLGIEPDPVP